LCFGFDTCTGARAAAKLNQLKGCEVPKTILYDLTDKRVYLVRRQALVQKRRRFFDE
jgi:hypothetical protein